jgi:hypothetical protein
MKIQNLDPKKYKRFFAFGCSLTNYVWPTWADIIGQDIPIYENWAHPAAGNHYIFNSVMEADAVHNFTQDDLIIIMWSNMLREDRYVKGQWIHDGPDSVKSRYGSQWVNNFYLDNRAQLIHNLAHIKATHEFLSNKQSDWASLAMSIYLTSTAFNPTLDSTLKDKEFAVWTEKCQSVCKREIQHLQDNYFNDADVITTYQQTLQYISGVYSWFRSTHCEGRIAPNNDRHPIPKEALQFLDYVWPNNTISQETRNQIEVWNTEIFNGKRKEVIFSNRL